MSGKFVGKLSDGGELTLSVSEQEITDKAKDVAEWMLKNGYASSVSQSVMPDDFSETYHSPQFSATAITPSQEHRMDHVREHMQEELDFLIETSDIVTYPNESAYRTPSEALNSVERNGLRLEVEAFAEDEDMPHRAKEELPFGGYIDNREEVEEKLRYLDDCLQNISSWNEIEINGYVHHYFSGLKGEPTPKEAIEDIENGISLYAEVNSEDQFYMKAGYLRPNVANGEHGGSSIERPFFGYYIAQNPKSENGADEAREIADMLHEDFDQT